MSVLYCMSWWSTTRERCPSRQCTVPCMHCRLYTDTTHVIEFIVMNVLSCPAAVSHSTFGRNMISKDLVTLLRCICKVNYVNVDLYSTSS